MTTHELQMERSAATNEVRIMAIYLEKSNLYLHSVTEKAVDTDGYLNQ